MSALIITATATHRRSAPTRLEALLVPVLTDILATESPVQVTNERLSYILPYFVNYWLSIRTLATIYYRLVLVLRITKCIIQLIIIISRYCVDNHVLNPVYFPLCLRMYNILKYCLLFISMGKVTAQQGWHDICRRFISMICATKISYLIYIQFFTDENIGSLVN